MGCRQLPLNLYVVVAVALAAVAVVESQQGCHRGLPGVGNFERNHVYFSVTDNPDLTIPIAKEFTINARGPYPRTEANGDGITVNPVFQGWSNRGSAITYYQLSGLRGPFCYAHFVKILICLSSPRPGYFDENSRCAEIQQGLHCVVIFHKATGFILGASPSCQADSKQVDNPIKTFEKIISEQKIKNA